MSGTLLVAVLLSLVLRTGQEPRFTEPQPVGTGLYSPVVRDGRTVALDLDRGLPGVPEVPGRYRFPFADGVDRVEVLVAPNRACTVLIAGGVRSSLSYHVLRAAGGRVSVRFPDARLLHGFLRPSIDDRASVLGCVFEDPEGVQVRILSVLGLRPSLLLARTLATPPDRFRLETVLGDPRVSVLLGRVRSRAPGETEHSVSDEVPAFLHPLASFPRSSVSRIDFGVLEEDGRSTRAFRLENPGQLPLRLLLRCLPAPAWRLDVDPTSLVLEPGASREVTFVLSCAEPPLRLSTRLEVLGISGAGDPLAQIALSAKGMPSRDRAAPTLDRNRVHRALLPQRRARIVGGPGAVQDPSSPCKVGDPTGVTGPVAADGSFEIEIPLPLDGRILIWTEDARGNRSKATWIGDLHDRNPPVLQADRIRIGLPTAGLVEVEGAPGAVQDETTPIRVEVEVDRRRAEQSVSVRSDGSFRARVQASPGQEVRIVVLDGAAPLNRTEPLVLGRVLPFIEERGRDLWLHGPAAAEFDLRILLPATGEVPEMEVTRYRGRLDGRGMVVLDPVKIGGARLLRFSVFDPASGRPLSGRFSR